MIFAADGVVYRITITTEWVRVRKVSVNSSLMMLSSCYRGKSLTV
ncbi:ribc1, putative [Schistosoma mansoni]|nr:ribc1, putative [Schistosoma mansoni]|eukprot:XP_018644278.1 ribc1, putative [Schistosoma mansoni]